MNIVIMGAGNVFIGLLILVTLWAVGAKFVDIGPINGSKGADGYICKVAGFGFVYSKPGTLLNDNLNNLRKTQDKRWFFTAPAWFNEHIINLGGKK